MLPEQEDSYEILINGSIIVELELNKYTYDAVITSIVDIDEYIKILTNESDRDFYRLAKEIGSKSINIQLV